MPSMRLLEGGSLSDEEMDRQWQAAWALIAEACEQGLTGLHPLHPRRDDLLSLTRVAHRAAGLPAVSLQPRRTVK